jgi:hypothetical protein
MLEQRSAHPLWMDENMNTRLLERLGSSAEACASTMSLIEEMLKQLGRESQGFQSALAKAGVSYCKHLPVALSPAHLVHTVRAII